METNFSKSFLDGAIYQNPHQAFYEVIERLGCGEEFASYLSQVLASDNPKDDSHQERIKLILDSLLAEGKKDEAGLVFNLHRIFTKFRGYDANEEASSDVNSCFGEDFEIPEEGLIVVDFSVTKNLPAIIEVCEQRSVDLSRIRVCVPKAILAAQLMQMSEEKRAEFEGACSKLREDQFIVKDENHNADIFVEGDVAIWFSPRTMPITPGLHAETEDQTINNYVDWFRNKVTNIVSGGRVYANLAYGETWQPLGVEMANNDPRLLAKLTGISRSVATKIVALLLDELGFRQLGQSEFDPAIRDAKIDHAKFATEFHVLKV